MFFRLLKKTLVINLCLSLFFAVQAIASVNLKNGNFYISYVDLNVPGGGKTLNIKRTYNSKAVGTGWFGFGWGSKYETYLKSSADGSVVVHENGLGAQTRFTPAEKINSSKAVDKIIAHMKKHNKTLSSNSAGQLKKNLMNNAELRHIYAVKFNVTTNLPKGTVLFSNRRGIQKIVKTAKGFKRDSSRGKSEYFNNAGKLVQIKEKNGHTVNFKYDKQGNLKWIKDSSAKQIFFDWYSNGLVKSVWSSSDKKAEYKYSRAKDLISSKDINGNLYVYEYDSNHNMKQISYEDKTKLQISYESKTQFASKIIERDNRTINYQYKSKPSNPNRHYWTLVKKKGFDGKPIENRYEYEIKQKPDGELYTYRIMTIVNSIKTETIYSECCSLPLKIVRGNRVTNFEYNSKGLMTKKSSNSGEFVKISYDKKHNKINKVVNNKGVTQFSYDRKGQLTRARNDKGKIVKLVYNRKGRITKMIDQHSKKKKSTRILAFKYNSMGKPVEISMKKVGKINVAYNNNGEIKKVESKSGHKMAMQVTRAFQNLLSIVKPAGVNLNI
jgi:YD repeat-containing protein